MTRKLTFLILALLALISGPGWGQTGYTIDFANNASSATAISSTTNASTVISENSRGYVTTKPFTVNSGNCYYGDTKTCIRTGKSNNSASLSIALSETGKVTPTSIIVHAYTIGNKNIGFPFTINGVNEANGKVTSEDAKDFTFNFTLTENIESITIASEKAVYINSITVIYQSAPAATLESIEVSGEAADLWTADEFSHEGITVMANWDEGDPTDVTSACEYSGYDMTSAGEQTVTVSYTAGEVTKSDTYTVTVNTIGNTQDEPYTVAQAKALIDAGDGLNEEVYVEGIICQVDSYNSTYSSITYWISTDGTTTDKFEVYSGLNAEDQNPFTSKDDLTVGYHAIVKGTIQKFNSTYEFSQNSRLVSYTPPVTHLPTPTGLTVSNLSMNGATLSWDAVEHASSYTVYVTGINYEETFEPTTNSIVLDGLTPGTTYLWTVKAIGDGVTYLDSEESGTAGFTTPTTVIYNINFETQQTGGTIEIEYEQAAAGEYVYAIATADYHYSFTQWNFSPAVTIYDGEDTDYIISFIMPDSDVTVSATFTEDPKYTVTYAKGGDDVTGEDPETVSYYEDDVVILEENPYTRTGYTFYIWKVEDANDTQYLYENATFEMPASNVTVTPNWDEKDPATITLKDKGAQYGGTINGYVGDNLLATLTAAGVENPTGLDVMPDYEFAGWAQAKDTENPNIATAETTIADDITLYAVYANVIPGTTTYQKVSNLTDIVDGRWVIVNDNYALPSTTTTSSPVKNDDYKVTITDNQISSIVGENMIWNFTFSEGKATVKNNEGSYLYATSSNSGLRVSNTSDTWTFETNSIGFAMKESNNSRYCATYKDGNDWRSYNSASHSNYGDGGKLYLYKENTTPGTTIYDFEESAKIYTVTYDANGAEGEVPAEAMLFAQGDEYTLASAEGLTKEHHTFAGWKANTDEQTYAAGSKYTFGSASVTFTAQWTEDEKYTVSYHVNGAVSTNDVYAGEMQLPVSVTAPNGYTFVGWTTEPIVGVAQSATYFSSYNVTGNVYLYAVFAIAETVESTEDMTYSLLPSNFATGGYNVNDGDKEINGITLTIKDVYQNSSSIQMKASSGSLNNKFALGQKITSVVVDVKTNSVKVYEGSANNSWTEVTGSNGTYTFSDNKAYFKVTSTDKYAQVNSITVNYVGTTSSTVYSNFCTSVTALSGNLADATTVANTAYYISRTATVEGEVTINGVLGNADASLLIINDGGQLIHHNAGVAATFQKSINGYTGTNDHYYLIANPTDNTTVANLTNENGYDLYTFNPAGDGAGNEWINMKSSQAVANGTGYLYANSSDVTLEFAGELTPASKTEVTLVKATAGTGTGIDFPGFNLIGNPFACNAYPTDENGIFMPFYKTNETGSELTLVKNVEAIAPCEGFFVEAEEDGQTVVITTEESEVESSALSLTVSQNRGSVIDRAIVSFNGRSNLHKFMLNPAHTNISLAKGGENFAAVSTEAEGEMPVNFKAEKNGTYTITVNTENVDAEYLHLIDNMTGADTDLLSTSSYTFDAKTSDYASRFKLVFGVKNDNEEMSQASSFAYINNGEIVISNEGRATLQVIDVLGRIVSSEEINGECRISTNGLTAGLYILNLNGMTQKIVVR